MHCTPERERAIPYLNGHIRVYRTGFKRGFLRNFPMQPFRLFGKVYGQFLPFSTAYGGPEHLAQHAHVRTMIRVQVA